MLVCNMLENWEQYKTARVNITGSGFAYSVEWRYNQKNKII